MNAKNHRSALLLSFSLCSLYALPLVIWGGYYWDDVIRTTTGLYGWTQNGRPLAELLFLILNSGGLNANFYPLPQIAAISIMSLTVFLCWRKFLSDKGVISVLCCLPILTSPMFVENLSFRYDSFTMSLSVLVACMPFFIETSGIKSFLIKLASVIAFLCLYQASITVYISISVLSAAYLSKKERYRESINSVVLSASALFIGYFIYSTFISSNLISRDYNIIHSKILSISDPNFIQKMMGNGEIFYSFILKGTQGFLFYIITFISAISIAAFARLTIVSFKSGSNWSKTSSLFNLLSFPVLLLCIVGPVSMLQQPLFSPRVLIGYGAFLMCINIVVMWHLPQKLAPAFILPYLFMALFCYAYTNSIKSQNEYEAEITRALISDISELNIDRNIKIAISGRMPKSMQSKLAEKAYPIIHSLTPILVNNNSAWAIQRFQQYGLNVTMANQEESESIEGSLCNIAPFRKGIFYNLYHGDGMIYIDLNKKCK